jgi:hypothetical protein
MTLSCESVRERLADGAADAELSSHLRTCEACSAFSASLDALDAELDSLPRIDAPDALVEKTLSHVEAEAARAAQPDLVSSPSILVAAFAVLTAAVGALVVAPLTFLRWIGASAKTVRSGSRSLSRSLSMFAVATALCAVIGLTTFSRFGTTVKTRTRGADSVVNGLPTTWDEETEAEEPAEDFWGNDEAAAVAPTPPAAPAARVASADEATGTWQLGDGQTGDGQMGDLLAREQAIGGRYGIEGPHQPSADPTEPVAFGTLLLDSSGSMGGESLAHGSTVPGSTLTGSTLTGSPVTGSTGTARIVTRATVTASPAIDVPAAEPEVYNGLEEGRGPEGALRGALGDDEEGSRRLDQGLGWRGESETEHDEDLSRGGQLELRARDRSLLGPDLTPLPAGQPGFFAQADLDALDQTVATGEGVYDYRAPSVRWLDAQRTTGLAFAAHDGWWENTYVPGDAAMRVLHARLAAAGDRRLSGVSFSPLSLAETTSPTVPAVAAPTDRAVSLGVHADVAAIEGPTRVRMEVAIRGITQAAGRRGALRIALVIDARDGLDEAAQARVRSIVTALSRSASSRDRVMLVAAGSHGGTLVELGAMRAGRIEVALRHLFAGDGTTDAATLQAAVESALEGVASDDGAGLVLLATPDGEHDAALDQALHVGAIAGVTTSAVGISGGVALSDLDAIALAGQGRRCLVLSETDATAAVRSELTAAARLVARALRVRVRLAPGVELVDVIGSRALDAEESQRTRETEQAIDQQLAHRLGIGADRDDDQDGIRILLPSFYSGDSHTVMLDLLVARPGPVADVDVQFKDLVRLGNGSVSSALTLASGTSPRGPQEERVVASFVAHEVARALETAGDRVSAGDWAGARASLEEARSLIGAARTEVPGLATSPSVQADDALLGRYLTALSGGDPALVADSLHYAAHRRLVLPQLASAP